MTAAYSGLGVNYGVYGTLHAQSLLSKVAGVKSPSPKCRLYPSHRYMLSTPPRQALKPSPQLSAPQSSPSPIRDGKWLSDIIIKARWNTCDPRSATGSLSPLWYRGVSCRWRGSSTGCRYSMKLTWNQQRDLTCDWQFPSDLASWAFHSHCQVVTPAAICCGWSMLDS